MRKIAAIMTSSLLVALLQGCAAPHKLQDRPSPPAYKAEPAHKAVKKKINPSTSDYRKPVTRASAMPDAAAAADNREQLMEQRGGGGDGGGGGGGGGGSGGGGW